MMKSLRDARPPMMGATDENSTVILSPLCTRWNVVPTDVSCGEPAAVQVLMASAGKTES